jgi:hypothetical protein
MLVPLLAPHPTQEYRSRFSLTVDSSLPKNWSIPPGSTTEAQLEGDIVPSQSRVVVITVHCYPETGAPMNEQTAMSTNTQPLCLLTDLSKPAPHRPVSDTYSISSKEELGTLLQIFATKEPRLLCIEKANGMKAFLGIGGNLAGIRLYPHPAVHRSWRPKPRTPYSLTDLWFVVQGEECSYRAQSVMPVEDVIAFVGHIFEYDELPDTVAWVNARGEALQDRSLLRLRDELAPKPPGWKPPRGLPRIPLAAS